MQWTETKSCNIYDGLNPSTQNSLLCIFMFIKLFDEEEFNSKLVKHNKHTNSKTNEPHE